MNLSFAGCGFLGIYHVGVASCFKKYAEQVIYNQISGASAGAIAACCLLCGCCLGKCTSDVLRIATKARSRALGPLHPSFQVVRILRDGLRTILPADAHLICSGRLSVSLTRVSDGKNVVVSMYETREDLIQVLICSAFVPVYCGMIPPSYKGVRYIDGGLSDNLPVIDDKTITVSPFAGESDICPDDNSSNFLSINITNTSIQMTSKNIYRMSRAFFPPHPEILSKICQQGFDDALKFLQRNNMISCTRCLSMQSSIYLGSMTECSSSSSIDSGSSCNSNTDRDVDDDYDNQCSTDDSNCEECKKFKKVALLDTLPPSVAQVLQATIDSANTGVLARIFRYKAAKVLAVMSIPWLLPIDIAYCCAEKFIQYMPALPRDAEWILNELASRVQYVLKKIEKRKHIYSARFTCQFALTEVEIDSECKHRRSPTQYNQKIPTNPSKIKNVNFGFTVDWKADPLNGKSLEQALSSDGADRFDEQINVVHDAFDFEEDALRSTLHVESADAFENVLQVTNQQDDLMACYYMHNEENMKLMKIFDVSEQDLNIMDDMTWDADMQQQQQQQQCPQQNNVLELSLDD